MCDDDDDAEEGVINKSITANGNKRCDDFGLTNSHRGVSKAAFFEMNPILTQTMF